MSAMPEGGVNTAQIHAMNQMGHGAGSFSGLTGFMGTQRGSPFQGLNLPPPMQMLNVSMGGLSLPKPQTPAQLVSGFGQGVAGGGGAGGGGGVPTGPVHQGGGDHGHGM